MGTGTAQHEFRFPLAAMDNPLNHELNQPAVVYRQPLFGFTIFAPPEEKGIEKPKAFLS